MTEETSDEIQLIDKILDGNKNLYRKLVDRYAPVVFHVVRGFVNDEEEVQELAQQIFVKTYEKLDSFNRQSKFSSWLYMIAKNHCRDYAKNIRRNNKRFSEMESFELQSKMSQDTTTEEDIEVKEQSALLSRALKQINSDYAEAFLMKYRDDMTYKAMASRLNESVSALKVRVHRARKELKDIMEQKI
ncbi:MAG: sigma-70 family RNA polymerase sigma factor [Balneolaceae bacterium]|nr:sigma-70 family RNA polymerase sigma factor [Balneolaceae bacterium]